MNSRATQLRASVLPVLAFALLGAFSLSAQDATISGVVRAADSRDPIKGATVILAGTPLSSVTDARGKFVLRRLSGGDYHLRVMAMGFRVDSLSTVSIADGEERVVTLDLERVSLVLEEVIVSASRVAQRRDESSVSIAALPSREVLQRNVATLDKALVFVPGVTFNGREQIDIRGATGISRGVGSRVLMLLDGHPILSGDGGEVDFGTIPLFDLDRTEIVKGAYSAVYGSNAVGGVVNIITKPVDDEPETIFRGHADAYVYQPQYEWAGELRSALGAGVQHSRRIGTVGARASVGYEGTEGFTENGESNRFTGRVKLTSTPTSRHPWDVYAVFSRDRAGEFFTWRSAEEPFRVPQDEVGDHTIDLKLLTGATVTPVARENTLLQVSPYFNINSLQNHLHVNDNWHQAVKPGFSAQLSWYTSSKHEFTVGADGAGTWVTSNFLGEPRIFDIAVFAQDEFPLAKNLKASFGVRLDRHQVDIGETELAVSPKLGLVLRLAPQATVRMSVGGGYRAPSAMEQFVSTYQYGFEVVPNPELMGEQAWSGEVGTTMTLFGKVRIDGAIFASTYHDLIGPAPAPGQPFVFQFQNVARARVAGVDFGINAQVVPNAVEVQAGYLFLSTEDLIQNQPLPYRSRHNVTGTVNLFGGLAGVDARYRSRIEEVLGYPFDPRSAITVVDVRLGYRIAGILWQLKFANLFNSFYVDVQERNPGAPRSISIAALHGM